MVTQDRKAQHLNICLNENIETPSNLLEDVVLVHRSLPEIDFKEIDTSAELFGKQLKLPLTIAAVTGGIPKAEEINKQLAQVAEEKGIGFAVGSQRAMIEDPSRGNTYAVRDVAPDTLLLGNIGITQTREFSTSQIKEALDYINADALCIHINPAQEIFQPDGDYNFKDCLPSLEKLCNELDYPVIGKEVGNGISREVALQLKKAGVKAIDVGGYGGSNWALIDSLRGEKDIGGFKSWGIPTAASILEVKDAELPIIATGGIRNGLEMAKALALGADICGIALPFLRILHKENQEGVRKYIDKLEEGLKTAMFLTGSKNIEELKKSDFIVNGKLLEWAQQRRLNIGKL